MINNFTTELPKRYQKSKYHNKKIEINGITFDSKKEGNRYLELKLQEKLGLITELVLQPEFELQKAFKHNTGLCRAIKYIADFSYWKDGVKVIEDTKGMKTDVYKLKKKMFLFKYPKLKLIET